MFDGCTVHLLPGREMSSVRRKVLRGIIKNNGGAIAEELTAAVSHVVAAALPSLAVPVEAKLVTADWLSQSVLKGRRLAEAEFQVCSPARARTPDPLSPKRDAAEAKAAPLAAAAEEEPSSIASKDEAEVEKSEQFDTDTPSPLRRKLNTSPVELDPDVSNAAIARQLKELAEAYSARGDRWRSWQLAKAERLVRTWPEPLREPKDFDRIAGLGPKTREKCREILATGALTRLDAVRGDEATKILQDFTCIHGAGESVARRWFAAGCRSLDDLRQREDELGFTRTQRLGLKYVKDFQERIPRAEAVRIVETVGAAADRAYGINKVEITPCGSMRRGATTMSDIDIVLAPREGCVLAGGLKPLLAELSNGGNLKEELGGHAPNSPWEDGEETFLGVFRLAEEGSLHRRVDLILCQRAHRPVVMLNWTGSGLFLRELHRLASYKGLKISPTQLLARGAHGAVAVPVTAEEDIFETLGLPYRPPAERELDDGLMRLVQAARPGGPALKRQKSESTSPQAAASSTASASQLLCLEISEDEGAA